MTSVVVVVDGDHHHAVQFQCTHTNLKKKYIIQTGDDRRLAVNFNAFEFEFYYFLFAVVDGDDCDSVEII